MFKKMKDIVEKYGLENSMSNVTESRMSWSRKRLEQDNQRSETRHV